LLLAEKIPEGIRRRVLERPEAFRKTGAVVRELFTSACSSVLVAGYAVYKGREVFRSLSDRMTEVSGLQVRLFLDVHRQRGDSSPDAELLAQFARRFREQEWPGGRLPEVFYDPRSLDLDAAKRSSLHAKCVVVDRRVAFVSSANFTDSRTMRRGCSCSPWPTTCPTSCDNWCCRSRSRAGR
jgi:phosphatidylserine/phosphatidylglycerophosphate/cardiolipin synthase-like enzyme